MRIALSKEYGFTLTPENRIGRVSFLLRLIFLTVLANIITLLVFYGMLIIDYIGAMGYLFVSGLSIALTIIFLMEIIRLYRTRLHDFGASGWWILVILIPFGLFLFLLVLVLWPGNLDENKYGPPPGRWRLIARAKSGNECSDRKDVLTKEATTDEMPS